MGSSALLGLGPKISLGTDFVQLFHFQHVLFGLPGLFLFVAVFDQGFEFGLIL